MRVPPGMARGELVIADRHLDQRHEQVPALVRFDRVEALLERLVRLEVLAGREAPDALVEARRKRPLAHS